MGFISFTDFPGISNEQIASAVARIRRRTVVREDGCHVCDLSVLSDGYSSVSFRGRTMRTHRFMWLAMRGPIPDGLVLDHLCRTRDCCNLDHLEVVTYQVNTARGDTRAFKTHCKRGHEYGPRDIRPNGVKDCRRCHLELKKKRLAAWSPEKLEKEKAAARKRRKSLKP